jgi:hypothetical protein
MRLNTPDQMPRKSDESDLLRSLEDCATIRGASLTQGRVEMKCRLQKNSRLQYTSIAKVLESKAADKIAHLPNHLVPASV